MNPIKDGPARALVLALPLPLAQAWRRVLYAQDPGAVHDRSVLVLEAVLKYLTSAGLATWAARGAREATVQKACETLVRPSLGHWASLSRVCLPALPDDDPVRGWIERVRSRSVTVQVPGLDGHTVGRILDSLPAYRNALAHGAGLTAASATERAPAALSLARETLAAVVDEHAPVLIGRAGDRTVRLVGPTAIPLDEESGSVAADLVIHTDGQSIALAPLWIFDPDEDDVLVLNKGAGLKKVEYLSYGVSHGGTGLTVRKGPAADLAAQFLRTATGRASIDTAAVAAMVEESEVRELAGRAQEQWIGPYRIVRQFAKGGQGVLYEAIQEDPPRRVALKVLPLHAAVDDAARRRFKEEGEALGRVEHPGVVPVYSTGEHEGVPWIAMRFVEGKSLAEVLGALHKGAGCVTLLDWHQVAPSGTELPASEAKKPHAERVVEIVRDAARALHACHESGVVHRDVKPGNVMLDAEGRVLITDFGLARSMQPRTLTFTRRFVGTLQYAAPESLLAAGKRGPDVRVDVYGLGAILYEALSLRRPFAEYERDEGALLQAVQTKEPPPLRKVAPWVPKELATITAKAMEKDRDARYPSAAALAEDLSRYLEGEPILARPAGPIIRGRKWSRRHPGKAVALVATVVIILIALGALVARSILRARDFRERVAEARAHLGLHDYDSANAALGKADALYSGSMEVSGLRASINQAREEEKRASAAEMAESARREARDRESDYQQLKLELASLWARITKDRYRCFSQYATAEERAALAGLESVYEAKKLEAEGLIQAAREALERAARHEELIGGISSQTDAEFADYYLARWQEALDTEDNVRAASAELAVKKHDRAKARADKLLGRGTLSVTVEPSEAEVFLFRYASYETIRQDIPVVPRLVPVPTTGVRVIEEGPWLEGFHPGDLCLVVTGVDEDSVAARVGIHPGDLVIRMNGGTCGDGLLAERMLPDGQAARQGIQVLDRIESLDGEVVEGYYEWRQPRCKEEKHTHRLIIGGKTVEATCRRHPGLTMERTLRLSVAPPTKFIQQGASVAFRLLCLCDDTLRTVDVPAGRPSGIRCHRTAYPLIRSAKNRIPHGRPIEMDPGSYVLSVRCTRFEEQRYPLFLSRGGKVQARVVLNPKGTTPDGFVYIPGGAFLYGGGDTEVFAKPRQVVSIPPYFIGRLEVTFRDWMQFLNDSATIEKVRNGTLKPDAHFPRAGARRFMKLRGDDFLCRQDVGTEDTPILGLSWDDIEAYLDWRNSRARANGEPWQYSLPSEAQWEKAARGVDGRDYPWGNRFDFSLAVSAFREFQTHNLLGEEPGGFEPRDESPFGILDMAGSRIEWTNTPYDAAPGFYVRRGGGYECRRGLLHLCSDRNYTRSSRPDEQFGFRLVARRRE